MTVLNFKDVWEMYRIKFIVEGKPCWEDFWALQGINFAVEKGEVLGIIGENGSGKSTILRLIAGMLKPDRGQVEVSGSVSGLLELGAGFQIELTGRENIYLQAELFGLRTNDIEDVSRRIIDFAEIGKFIDAPVKCYSQGMFVRLAFAIAVHMDSDIFLVDDTLAVGDEYFQKKCIEEIFKIKEKGKTVVIVTHDMAILQKLCARALFLKHGVLIKDESTVKAVSFYSQTVGSPKGIAVIDRKRFSLVFNNGRLLINWDGRLITPYSGIYAKFGVSGVWYDSFQAEWDVQVDGGKLVATGRFYHLEITQVWRIDLCDNYEMKWDIEIETAKDMQLPEVYTNVMLTDEYREWFADFERGEFPEIKEGNDFWKSVSLKDGSSVCIGVFPQGSASGDLPAIIFEQARLRYRGQADVLNSDYINPARILQYKTIPMGGVSNQSSRRICFSGKIIVGADGINDYVSKAQREFTVSGGRLKVKFDNGRLSLSFDDIPLTKADHMYSAIFVKQRWLTSDSAIWTLEGKADNEMSIRGNWHNLGIAQTWRIHVYEDHSFSWDVDMEVDREVAIEQQRLRCFFSEGFKLFFSDAVSERFEDVFNDTDMDLLKRCISTGEVGLKDLSGRLPLLSLSFSRGLNNFVKVFNSDYYSKARLLHLEKVEPEANIVFLPGKYECFKAKFSFSRDNLASFDTPDASLKDGNISFVFSRGSGKFRNGPSEITKNIALYTSMRSRGRWYDSSSSAYWKIIYNDEHKIEALGKWMDLPLHQHWEISSKGGGVFEWRVSLGIDREIEIDRLQANVMFSEKFSRWFGGKDAGVFPDFKDDINDDWDCLWQAEEGVRGQIGLEKDCRDGIPAVSLSLQEPNPGWSLKVINSDRYHRGRLLQYSSYAKTNFLPGKFSYFSGLLNIRE